MEKIENKKNFIILILFIIINLFVFKLFPAVGNFQEVITLITFLIIIPFLFSKFILKRNLHYFGIRKGDYRKGIMWSTISLLVSLLIFYIITQYTPFFDKYIIPSAINDNILKFLFYEFVIVLGINFIYEFFFRGFVMFNFIKETGYIAILIQWFVFIFLIMLNSSFSWNFIPYIIFIPFAGLIAYKSKSLLYSLIAQSVFILIIDIVYFKNLL